MKAALNNPQLNEQQLDMIRLLKNPMPEEHFMQIRRLEVQLLGKELDAWNGLAGFGLGHLTLTVFTDSSLSF